MRLRPSRLIGPGCGVVCAFRAPGRKRAQATEEREMSSTVNVHLNVNGVEHDLEVEPRLLLVHALRDRLGLTGTHVGCDTSNCGACTVHLNGQAVKSCTVLAVQADGEQVTTIEGLGSEDNLHPMQEAFWA